MTRLRFERKPHPLSPSPFRGGGTKFDRVSVSASPLLGEMLRNDRRGRVSREPCPQSSVPPSLKGKGDRGKGSISQSRLCAKCKPLHKIMQNGRGLTGKFPQIAVENARRLW